MLIRPVVCFSEETENKITANILEKQKIACLIFNPGSEITQHIKHCQLWLKATADSFQKIEALQQIAILHIKNNELQEAEKNLEEAFSYLKQANELNYLKYWSDLQQDRKSVV